jgi:hypothetical protein
MNREKYKGKLFYNHYNDRIGVANDSEIIDDGLHCGQTIEVFINGKWTPTRIEMAEDWYLVGIKGVDNLEGLEVML